LPEKIKLVLVGDALEDKENIKELKGR